MTSYKYFTIVPLLMLLFFESTNCRQHQLVLNNDMRNYFRISTFGFWKGGKLEVKLNYITFSSTRSPKLGLTLTKTVSESITPYMENQQKCFLADDALTTDGNIKIISFLLDLENDQLLVNCSSSLPFLHIKTGAEFNITLEEAQNHRDQFPEVGSMSKQKRSAPEEKPAKEPVQDKAQNEVSSQKGITPVKMDEVIVKKDELTGSTPKVNTVSSVVNTRICSSFAIPFKNKIAGQRRNITDLQFQISMDSIESVGLYSIYFHNCPESKEQPLLVNFSISIVEQNGDNFLSAGEMPLPNLYFLMSFIFFITGCVWIAVLRRKREETFKIHYLMGALVYLKSLSLLFHGINYHIIARDGCPMEAWAVLYYITHLLKGALLFITIVLIGTGWAFIKHILSDKDKKIFMIVIPLQVLANVAEIIMEESEEGNSQHYTWRDIFIFVDLICCGAILFPVVWSIRHLQEASQTDGKAAINLEKLKLFRHFYVMIICYIYFTRIIVHLLQLSYFASFGGEDVEATEDYPFSKKLLEICVYDDLERGQITVIFQYEWLDEVFREAATFTFYIVTGINFQPTVSNPYFRLSQEDGLEMDEVITQTGFTENVSKTVRSRENAGQGDEGTATKRESSHEYD